MNKYIGLQEVLNSQRIIHTMWRVLWFSWLTKNRWRNWKLILYKKNCDWLVKLYSNTLVFLYLPNLFWYVKNGINIMGITQFSVCLFLYGFTKVYITWFIYAWEVTNRESCLNWYICHSVEFKINSLRIFMECYLFSYKSYPNGKILLIWKTNKKKAKGNEPKQYHVLLRKKIINTLLLKHTDTLICVIGYLSNLNLVLVVIIRM